MREAVDDSEDIVFTKNIRSLAPTRTDIFEHGLTGKHRQPPQRASSAAVIDFNSRYSACRKVFTGFDLIVSLLGGVLPFNYLVLLDFTIIPSLPFVIVFLLVVRVLLTVIGSCCIYWGLRKELRQIASQLGNKLEKAKTVREMVSQIENGDVQLQIMSHLISLTRRV